MILTDTSNIYLIYNWSYNWPLCSIFTKSLLIVIVSVCWCIDFCILCVCFVMAVIHEIIYKNEKIHIKGFIIINKFKISNYIQKTTWFIYTVHPQSWSGCLELEDRKLAFRSDSVLVQNSIHIGNGQSGYCWLVMTKNGHTYFLNTSPWSVQFISIRRKIWLWKLHNDFWPSCLAARMEKIKLTNSQIITCCFRLL